MKLAMIFLNKIEYLEDILAAFLEIGIGGATVINSTGMGRIISQNIPIFAGLRDAFAGSSPGNKTICAVVEEAMVEQMASAVEDICGSFDTPGVGVMVVLDTFKVYGVRPGLD